MEIIILFAKLSLCFSSMTLFSRLILGPGVLNRAMALELLMINIISLSGIFIVKSGASILADYLIVCSLLPFVGSVAFTRYIAQRRIE